MLTCFSIQICSQKALHTEHTTRGRTEVPITNTSPKFLPGTSEALQNFSLNCRCAHLFPLSNNYSINLKNKQVALTFLETFPSNVNNDTQRRDGQAAGAKRMMVAPVTGFLLARWVAQSGAGAQALCGCCLRTLALLMHKQETKRCST